MLAYCDYSVCVCVLVSLATHTVVQLCPALGRESCQVAVCLPVYAQFLKRTVDAMLSNFPGFVTICSEQDVMSLCKHIVYVSFAYLSFTVILKWHKQVYKLLCIFTCLVF